MLLAMLIVMLLFAAVQQKRASEAVTVTDETSHYNADTMNGLNIYVYGKTIEGGMIPFHGGPMWLIYEEHGCAACHGENGRGKNAVEGVDAPPPNITKLTGSDGPISFEEFSSIVKSGEGSDGQTLSMDMPRYSMPDNYLRDLYEYVQGF